MKSASRKPQPKRKYFKSRGFSRLFCFSWEQRKAKDICSIGTGKSNTQDQVYDGKYPFYIRSDVPVRSNKYLYDCEAVITIGDGNIGKVFHYVNGKFDLHQRCYKMTDFQGIWGKYFFYYFSTKFYDRAMKMTAKATVDSVRLEMISEMDIKKPLQISEQKQIAEFFASLDNLITLHQRNSIGYIFKVRAYTNAWEQRKLGDCFDERNESMPDGELISVTINDGIRKFSELGRHDNSNDDKSKYKKVCVGDIAYNSMRMWQGASGYSPYEGIVSPAYTVLSPKTGVISRCLAYQFKLPEMIHTFQVNSQGITSDNWNLKYPAFSEIDISVATQVKEQELIASFFTNLDNLITLHQRERKNRLFGGKNVKQYNFSRSVLQLLRAMDTRLQRRGCSQGDYG